MVEQEIKLTAPSLAVLQQILQSELIQRLDSGVGRQDAVHYLAVYYDTECNALTNKQCSLRVRREGERLRAAVKFSGSIVNGLSQRQELEADISNWPDNISQLPHGELQNKVLENLPPDASAVTPLIARVKTDMHRSIRNLNFAGSEIELSVDQGLIIGKNQQVTLYEVELELKQGDLANIIKLGKMFLQQFPLTPSTQTKHRIGLQLV